MLDNTVNQNLAIDRYTLSDYEKFRSYDRIQFKLNQIVPQLKEGNTLLDVGCAKGELIYFLKERMPGVRYTGLEYAAPLLEKAKQEPKLKDVRFIHGDARNFALDEQFDFICLSGVLCVFDDPAPILNSLLTHLKPGGRFFLFDFFNPFDYDTIVRFRKSENLNGIWESGYNQHSQHTIERILKDKCKSFEWNPFEISVDLKADPNMPMSYTVKLENEKRLLLTTTGNVLRFFMGEAVKL